VVFRRRHVFNDPINSIDANGNLAAQLGVSASAAAIVGIQGAIGKAGAVDLAKLETSSANYCSVGSSYGPNIGAGVSVEGSVTIGNAPNVQALRGHSWGIQANYSLFSFSVSISSSGVTLGGSVGFEQSYGIAFIANTTMVGKCGCPKE
jgi:hypothetical protein